MHQQADCWSASAGAVRSVTCALVCSRVGSGAELTRCYALAQVLNFQEAQDSYRVQLKHEVRYVTTMSYGGHGAWLAGTAQPDTRAALIRPHRLLAANQFIGIYNLLYIGKILHRVVVMCV